MYDRTIAYYKLPIVRYQTWVEKFIIEFIITTYRLTCKQLNKLKVQTRYFDLININFVR